MEMKQTLWNILEKYDSKENSIYCDSLSKLIQEKESSEDILNVFNFCNQISATDRQVIDKVIGNKFDYFFFSL